MMIKARQSLLLLLLSIACPCGTMAFSTRQTVLMNTQRANNKLTSVTGATAETTAVRASIIEKDISPLSIVRGFVKKVSHTGLQTRARNGQSSSEVTANVLNLFLVSVGYSVLLGSFQSLVWKQFHVPIARAKGAAVAATLTTTVTYLFALCMLGGPLLGRNGYLNNSKRAGRILKQIAFSAVAMVLFSNPAMHTVNQAVPFMTNLWHFVLTFSSVDLSYYFIHRFWHSSMGGWFNEMHNEHHAESDVLKEELFQEALHPFEFWTVNCLFILPAVLLGRIHPSSILAFTASAGSFSKSIHSKFPIDMTYHWKHHDNEEHNFSVSGVPDAVFGTYKKILLE